MVLLQSPGSLHCDYLTGACHRVHMISFPTTDNSNPIGFIRSCDPSSRTAGMAACAGCRALFCFRTHSELAAFHITWYMSQNSSSRCSRICWLKNLKRLTNHVFFNMVGGIRCNNLSFTLEMSCYWVRSLDSWKCYRLWQAPKSSQGLAPTFWNLHIL